MCRCISYVSAFFWTPSVSYLKSPVNIKIFFSAIKCFSFFTVCFCGYRKLLLSLLSLPILYPGWAQQPQAYMAHLNYWCFPKSNLETELRLLPAIPIVQLVSTALCSLPCSDRGSLVLRQASLVPFVFTLYCLWLPQFRIWTCIESVKR